MSGYRAQTKQEDPQLFGGGSEGDLSDNKQAYSGEEEEVQMPIRRLALNIVEIIYTWLINLANFSQDRINKDPIWVIHS